MSAFTQQIHKAAQHIREQEPNTIDMAIIAGSGLINIMPELQTNSEYSYQDITGLSSPSVMSHQGRLTIGAINNQRIALCQGRYHLYEGYSAQQVSMLVYILSQLGVKKLIITNAAGALNAKYRPGDIMLIDDHINFTGQNPIIGQGDSLGNRFTDMSQAYSSKMIGLAARAATKHQLLCHQGVYVGVLGPSLETSAERRMFARHGGDAVGMSTVIEVIAANHCDMQVLGLSAITNLALGNEQQQVDSLEEVLHYAEVAGQGIKQVINSILTE
ncbi:MAG: purine-nucleoside phosphorylase [Acidiferrobacterales bacterium]|nr:purine-nucleoside phosphorylase [Acidiferrobacterales bacterium]